MVRKALLWSENKYYLMCICFVFYTFYYIFWEFHNICFDHIHKFQLFPDPSPLLYPTNFFSYEG